MTFLNMGSRNSFEASTFERIIAELFKLLKYKVVAASSASESRVDLVISNELDTIYVEMKFYRSQRIPSKILKDTTNKFAYYLNKSNHVLGLLIVNTIVSDQLKDEILVDSGVNIWDRQVIYSLLTNNSISLRDEFEQLLVSVQQGNDTYDVFSGIDTEKIVDENKELTSIVTPKYKGVPKSKGKQLIKELDAIKCGKTEWTNYENKCFEILQFLFEDDLKLWEKQSRTDDGLSRFDLICRIASTDDYWRALLSSFNSRFILFEFKNYCEEIDQGQIYTTERYLYLKGLRSVGFIIARNGASPNAITAAKGALREHGKLILILTNEDLHKMLNLKDNDSSPNDYLSNLLDEWLVSLSR